MMSNKLACIRTFVKSMTTLHLHHSCMTCQTVSLQSKVGNGQNHRWVDLKKVNKQTNRWWADVKK